MGTWLSVDPREWRVKEGVGVLEQKQEKKDGARRKTLKWKLFGEREWIIER